MQQIGLVK